MVVRIEPGDVDGDFPDSQPSEMLNMLAHILAKVLNSGGHSLLLGASGSHGERRFPELLLRSTLHVPSRRQPELQSERPLLTE